MATAANPGFLATQLEAMSPRDRKLLAGLVIFVGLVTNVVLAVFVRSVLNDQVSRIQAVNDSMDILDVMIAEHATAAAKVKDGEGRLASFEGKPVSAYVEETAKELDLQANLASVQEVGSEKVGTITQTRYKIELKKLAFEQKYGLPFVYKLEAGGYPVRIDLARFKTVTVSGEKYVDILLEVTGLKLGEAK